MTQVEPKIGVSGTLAAPPGGTRGLPPTTGVPKLVAHELEIWNSARRFGTRETVLTKLPGEWHVRLGLPGPIFAPRRGKMSQCGGKSTDF